jgi:cell division protein FtsB
MWIGTLALILVGLALLTTVIPFRQILDQQARVDATEAELARVQIENIILEDEVGALNTPQEIERLAREKLGYVMPGETAFVVLEPEEGRAMAVSGEAGATPDETLPWYVALWNFFTGADLSGA